MVGGGGRPAADGTSFYALSICLIYVAKINQIIHPTLAILHPGAISNWNLLEGQGRILTKEEYALVKGLFEAYSLLSLASPLCFRRTRPCS